MVSPFSPSKPFSSISLSHRIDFPPPFPCLVLSHSLSLGSFTPSPLLSHSLSHRPSPSSLLPPPSPMPLMLSFPLFPSLVLSLNSLSLPLPCSLGPSLVNSFYHHIHRRHHRSLCSPSTLLHLHTAHHLSRLRQPPSPSTPLPPTASTIPTMREICTIPLNDEE